MPAHLRSYQTTCNRNVAAHSAMDSTRAQHDLVLRVNALGQTSTAPRRRLPSRLATRVPPAQSPALQATASPGDADATECTPAPGDAGAAEPTPVLPAVPGVIQAMPSPPKRVRQASQPPQPPQPPRPPRQYLSTMMAPPPPPLGDAAVSGPMIVGGTSIRVTVLEQVGSGAAASTAATAPTVTAANNHSGST